jgi:hypothetical protein
MLDDATIVAYVLSTCGWAGPLRVQNDYAAIVVWLLLLYGISLLCWRASCAIATDGRSRRVRRAEAHAHRGATKHRRKFIRRVCQPPPITIQQLSREIECVEPRGYNSKQHGREGGKNCSQVSPSLIKLIFWRQALFQGMLLDTQRWLLSKRAQVLPSPFSASQGSSRSPVRFKIRMGKGSTARVVWDSGASISISPSKDDFVGEFNPSPLPIKLQGLAKGLTICGQGHVMWAVHDTTGQLRMIKVPAYYVPSTNVRLLSTTSLLQAHDPETILVEAHQLTLSGTPDDPTRGPAVARVDPTNNLPTSQAYYRCDNSPITRESFSVMNDGIATSYDPSAEPTSAPRESYPTSAPRESYPTSAPRESYPMSAPRESYLPTSVVSNENSSAQSAPVTMHPAFATRENVPTTREQPYVPTAGPGAEPVSAPLSMIQSLPKRAPRLLQPTSRRESNSNNGTPSRGMENQVDSNERRFERHKATLKETYEVACGNKLL